MDYAFAPGTTAQDGRARQLLGRRPDTTIIGATRHRNSLKQFLEHIAEDDDINKPVGNLLIAAHSDSLGVLYMPLYPGQVGPTEYKTILETINDGNLSIEIEDATIGYNNGDSITKSFHIKGCNIGKALPFLVKLKEALGNHVFVTAPLHYHLIYNDRRNGVFEGMAYEFEIDRPEPLESRDDVLAAFSAEGFTRYDGSGIPAEDWESWLPPRITRNNLRVSNELTLTKNIRVNLGTPIGTRTTLRNVAEFRIFHNSFTVPVDCGDSDLVPTDPAEQEAALLVELNGNDEFQADYGYPIYEQFGFENVDDFIAGFTWEYRGDENMLICTGRRYEYTVSPPILDVISGNYIFNFYPNSDSDLPAILDGLEVSDIRFFQTV